MKSNQTSASPEGLFCVPHHLTPHTNKISPPGGWGTQTLRAVKGEASRFKGAPGIPGSWGLSCQSRTSQGRGPRAPPPPPPACLSTVFAPAPAARLWNPGRLLLISEAWGPSSVKMGLQPLFCSEKPPCFADLYENNTEKVPYKPELYCRTHFCPTFLTHEGGAWSRWKLSSPSCLLCFSFFPSSSSPPPPFPPPTPQLPSSSFPSHTPTSTEKTF